MPETYVALDLETTGLDRERDAIIEIGAVRFDERGVLGTFSTLVNPRRPLPPQVQRLTGITEEVLGDAPGLEVAAGDFEEFLGDAVLVGHNVIGFDVPFLDAAGIRRGAVVYDTLDLASLLMPGLVEYNLAALASHFGIDFPVQHRALADAEVSRRVFMALREQASLLPPDVLSQVAQWLTPTAFPWRTFFAKAWEDAVAAGSTGVFRLKRPAIPLALSPARVPAAVKPQEALAVLASARERPDLFPDFDERPGQAAMVEAVTQALNDGQRLLVEAGTGTGKSLAYLIPAACYAAANGQRVVVSTATIGLQEQLTKKDIPTLQGLLSGAGREVRACQLKGRRNYLCLRQFDALKLAPVMTDAEARLASRVLIWLCHTETGDRAELRLTQEEESIWPKLSADGADCNPENSVYAADGTCFLQRARRTAEGSHIVVVNHALLLADTAAGGRVLPPYQHLVIDEAHHLEDEASRQFGFSGGERQAGELLGQCEGIAATVRSVLRGVTAALAPYERLTETARALRASASAARPRLKEFAERCLAFVQERAGGGGNDAEQRLAINRAMRVQPDWAAVEMAWENLRLSLKDVLAHAERLYGAIADAQRPGSVDYDLLEAQAGQVLAELPEIVAGIAAGIEEDDPQRVVWLERERTDGSLAVSWVPLAVAELLQVRLYEDRTSIVLTGATLSSEGGFRYMQERLGLQEADTLSLGSPFDYKKAALVLLAKDMPEPGTPEYVKSMAAAVVDLTRASRGRALVLFTSYADLRSVQARVRDPLAQEGIAVLAQGTDGSPRQLVRALLEKPSSVLLGTASFWEGVDIAGEALSLLIMARLPFTVPTDPVFAARSAQYDDGFNQYAVPQAVLRFKQGFGRLIRTRTDRGVLVVLDRRIVSKRYGEAFVRALPECQVRQALLREMPGMVGEWLGKEQGTGTRNKGEGGAQATRQRINEAAADFPL